MSWMKEVKAAKQNREDRVAEATKFDAAVKSAFDLGRKSTVPHSNTDIDRIMETLLK